MSMAEMGDGAMESLFTVVKCGWMIKKGAVVKNWKRRFFVLLSNPKQLKYFESDSAPKPKGIIDLSSVFEVRTCDLGDSKIPGFGFEVCTKGRAWALVCQTKQERDDWLKNVSDVVRNVEDSPNEDQ